MVKNQSKHRALSQIITSLILIAIVTTLGSVVLFRGLGEINTFSINLGNLDKNRIGSVQEDLVIENVHFKYNTKTIELSITNFGSVPTTVSSIVVTESNTQKVIYSNRERTDTLQILENKKITLTTNPTTTSGNFDNNVSDYDYVVSIMTSRGNHFAGFANPFNT
ncbi:MAG: hypothetical protein ACKO7N_06585 [Candidatus Nitrosotenuis sp.]